MEGDNASSGAGQARSTATGSSPTIFVCDPSVEGQRIADVLRAAGYLVADVPLTQLATRAGVQKPAVVLLDTDPPTALEEVGRLRRVVGSGSIDFVYLGAGEGPIRDADEALANQGSAFFLRPVDIAGLVRKLDALTGGPSARPLVRPSTPPPSIPVARAHVAHTREPGRDASRSPSPPPSSDRSSAAPSLPAPGLRTPGPPLPLSVPSLSELVEAPRSLASFGAVSKELELLLAEAELRAEATSTGEIQVPSPEEEIESVLPADVLALLDDPLDPEDDEDAALEVGVRPTGAGATNADGFVVRPTTAGGSRASTTGSGHKGGSTGAGVTPKRPATDAPLRARSQSSVAPAHGGGAGSIAPPFEAFSPPPPVVDVPAARPTTPSGRPASAQTSFAPSAPPAYLVEARGPSASAPVARPPAVSYASVAVNANEVRRYVGDAISRRLSGALCFEHEGALRRIVIRDGDLVTAASSEEGESLVSFLVARGELSREEAAKLAAKIPPYGRHAGAALVAHGLVTQDQLWPSLRAHAEWIATIVLRLPSATAQLEADAPGRLRTEPSVFGATTGPSLFVELVRRAVGAEEALEIIGGVGTRIGDGAQAGLLGECALQPTEIDLLARVRGGTVGDLLARAPDPEIVATLHALAMLGIVELVVAPFGARAAEPVPDAEIAALDEEAVRVRVRARLELVEEGDYFAVLGVPRDATGYEVRRAYLELRKAFEPSRILTPRLRDLAQEVQKIVLVLDEGYEILRDPARRERYRRAIDARP